MPRWHIRKRFKLSPYAEWQIRRGIGSACNRIDPMIYARIFEKEGDGGQDSATLYTMSCEFLEASVALRDSKINRINYTCVIYYLLCHSAELALKSLICSSGASIETIKKYGHDLEKLISKLTDERLIDAASVINIAKISPIYKDKMLEYRRRNMLAFPDVETLTIEIRYLHEHAFNALQ